MDMEPLCDIMILPHFYDRDPTGDDIYKWLGVPFVEERFCVGDMWLNKESGQAWIYAGTFKDKSRRWVNVQDGLEKNLSEL